jgi:DNA repair protein RecO (recombination protein O)
VDGIGGWQGEKRCKNSFHQLMQPVHVEGIVLQKVSYSETSIIIKLLTEHEGVKSFIFPGARSRKKKGNLVSPLAVLSVTYVQRKANILANITEIEAAVVYRDIPFNPYKSGILFFMNEILNNTVKEQEDNEELYQFVKNALQILDLSNSTSNFPIKFLIQLTKYLGFYPKVNPNPKYFDLREGIFSASMPAHPMYVPEHLSKHILAFANCKMDGENDPQIDLETRRKITRELINYYRLMFDNFKDLQSIAVLETVMHE